jgi:hypothetical protein
MNARAGLSPALPRLRLAALAFPAPQKSEQSPMRNDVRRPARCLGSVKR